MWKYQTFRTICKNFSRIILLVNTACTALTDKLTDHETLVIFPENPPRLLFAELRGRTFQSVFPLLAVHDPIISFITDPVSQVKYHRQEIKFGNLDLKF